MKVVHISTTDYGGAYKATERISEALCKCGVNSKVVVRSKCNDTNTIEYLNTFAKQLLSKFRNLLNLLLSNNEVITDMFGADLTRLDVVRDSDAIVLHWVNSFVSSKTIYKLAELGKPIFWVAHDIWPFTAGCHYNLLCDGYQEGCINCKKDAPLKMARRNSKIKGRLNQSVDITYVVLSNWEENIALNSSIISGQQVIRIANPIDLDTFYPKNAEALRKINNIDSDEKVLLFGADRLTNKYKGFDLFERAVTSFHEGYKIYCFGSDDDIVKAKYPNINFLGRLTENELCDWYNIADVMIVPSIKETFCYVSCEALCCGTPVVAFENTGIADQIVHKFNGYIARYMDVEDLKRGIIWCIEQYNREALDINQFRERYSLEHIGREYKDILLRSVENN